MLRFRNDVQAHVAEGPEVGRADVLEFGETHEAPVQPLREVAQVAVVRHEEPGTVPVVRSQEVVDPSVVLPLPAVPDSRSGVGNLSSSRCSGVRYRKMSKSPAE